MVTELLEKAEVQGYLTSDDVLEAFPEAEENLDQLEEVFSYLIESGIEIYENKAEAEAEKGLESDEESVEIEKIVEEEVKEVFDLSGISSDDTVGLYLKEMARVPLLTTEEEVRLAKLLVKGQKAEHQLAKNSHDPEERARLERIIEEGKAAREHLIKANTRLVVSIAKKYMGRGVPFLDLIQEGNLGLMKAV
ncbi:MAG: RNA polymerase sigma factor region1.1 domain-containing protein, partial [Chloroflexota bacterium]|nr:RNA polymerase sigma factor region1.1 domain-containing protein [Chloroflexota bacterium]